MILIEKTSMKFVGPLPKLVGCLRLEMFYLHFFVILWVLYYALQCWGKTTDKGQNQIVGLNIFIERDCGANVRDYNFIEHLILTDNVQQSRMNIDRSVGQVLGATILNMLNFFTFSQHITTIFQQVGVEVVGIVLFHKLCSFTRLFIITV